MSALDDLATHAREQARAHTTRLDELADGAGLGAGPWDEEAYLLWHDRNTWTHIAETIETSPTRSQRP